MKNRFVKVRKDLVIVGGGMPGIVSALQAARLGLKVALINNRGYFGGNASAEIAVNVSGATGAQEFNYYAREGGIIEELLLENMHRNVNGKKILNFLPIQTWMKWYAKAEGSKQLPAHSWLRISALFLKHLFLLMIRGTELWAFWREPSTVMEEKQRMSTGKEQLRRRQITMFLRVH